MQILQLLTLALSSLGQIPIGQVPFTSEGSLPAKTPDHYSQAIVIWHGLGDNYNSSGMQRMKEILTQVIPDVFVHSVYIDEDPQIDERRSLFGDANLEVDIACERLAQIPELAAGFSGIGFSQGGLFLRALIERCPNVTVSKLVTFGSPHMGVLELPLCARDDDWVCKRRNALLKRQVWNTPVQKSVVPAQYFRDPSQFQDYLEHSNFLRDVNNEKASTFSSDAKERFGSLEKLVLIKFDQDTTLVPKESAYFEENGVPFDQTRLYQEDLIGFRKLHQENKVDFYSVNDEHMRFLDQFFVDIVARYFGHGF